LMRAKVLVSVAAVLAAAPLMAARAAQPRKAAATLQIAIHEVTPEKQSVPHIFRGKFTIESLNGSVHLATVGSGTSIITPNLGTTKNIDGQQVTPFTGTDTLTSKSGTLTISFSGDGIAVNPKFNASVGEVQEYYNERGTWKITGAHGVYQGWKGGGRMASADTPSMQIKEWDGMVTT
jgi:hypothetical protein